MSAMSAENSLSDEQISWNKRTAPLEQKRAPRERLAHGCPHAHTHTHTPFGHQGSNMAWEFPRTRQPRNEGTARPENTRFLNFVSATINFQITGANLEIPREGGHPVRNTDWIQKGLPQQNKITWRWRHTPCHSWDVCWDISPLHNTRRSLWTACVKTRMPLAFCRALSSESVCSESNIHRLSFHDVVTGKGGKRFLSNW